MWSTRGHAGWLGVGCLMHAAEKGHATCVELLAERERDMKTTRRWCGYPLAPRPSASQRRWPALQSPPYSVASMLIPSCPIPQRILAGRSASSSGARTGPVCPDCRTLLRTSLVCTDLNVSSQICSGLTRCLAEAPLGTAGGPARPGSLPHPQPAHVHHLASGWSCRCERRN